MRFRGPWRVLDEQEVAEMRRLRANEGVPAHRLAERYGVSVRTVWRYLGDAHRGDPMRLRRIVDRWAVTYGIDLRQQERDALVAAVRHQAGLVEVAA